MRIKLCVGISVASEKIQRRVTKLFSALGDLSYKEKLKECDLTTLEMRRLRGINCKFFKILNGHENMTLIYIFSKLRRVQEL